MTLKEILEKLKSKLEKAFMTDIKGLPTSDTLADNRQVLIPTYIKDLNINTNLSSEEIKKYEQYKEELNLNNYDSIVKYAESSFKEMNKLRDSILEHIEESAKIKREISRDKDYKKIITEEFESVFREYEAYELFDDINEIKRDTEIRILAIQDKINEIEKSSKFKFWGARDRKSVQKSLIDVGDRLKINVYSGNLLATALNNEFESNGFLRNSIENFIKENNSDEVKSIIEVLLYNYYAQNLREFKAVSLLSKDVDSKLTPEYSLDEFMKLKLNEQLKTLVLDRKKLKEYLSKHKDDLLPKLKNIKEDIDKKYCKVLDDYKNFPLWAKERMLFQKKFNYTVDTLLSYEIIYNFFQKDISEKDMEKYYETLFLALYNVDDGMIHKSKDENIFLDKISYKIGKKYFCKFIDRTMEKLVKTSTPNVVNFINKMIKNKSSESILNNPSNLSLIGKLDRWGEYAYMNFSKDYAEFDDFVFSNYDDNSTSFLNNESQLKLYTDITKKINQKHTSNTHASDKDFPSIIFLNPKKYFYETYSKIRLSDEIASIASNLAFLSGYNAIIDRILNLDELSFYGITDREYDSSEKYKVIFELKDGKPHFKLKIGYKHINNVISRNTNTPIVFLEQLHDNLRLGIMDFLSYRYYSKEELQSLKDSGITIENRKYNWGKETEDGGLLCHGAGIYNKEQKELAQKFRKAFNNSMLSIFYELPEDENRYSFDVLKFFHSKSPLKLFYFDPLNFNRLFINTIEKAVLLDINGISHSNNQLNVFLDTFDDDDYKLEEQARRLIEDSCFLMRKYDEQRKNNEREEKE